MRSGIRWSSGYGVSNNRPRLSGADAKQSFCQREVPEISLVGFFIVVIEFVVFKIVVIIIKVVVLVLC